MIELVGNIIRVKFYNNENHFIIAVIEAENEERPITISGYMADYNDYEKYRFYGDYVIHPRYGKQFKMDHYEVVLADDRDEVIKYLSSPLFKGIGKAQATVIVDTLGTDCLDKIRQDFNLLNLVKGMTETKKETITAVLSKNDYNQEVINFFMGHGISMKNLGLIQSTYQEKTLEVLSNNPYCMIDDIDGIGFKTADDLALKLGFDVLDPHRIEACIVYCIKNICYRTGATYTDLVSIEKEFNRQIHDIDEDLFNTTLGNLIDDGRVIQEEERYYDKELYDSEIKIANFLNSFDRHEYVIDDEEVDDYIQMLEKNMNIQYGDKQKEAIHMFLQHSSMILTGGPGTGKTTILLALLRVYEFLYPDDEIALIAPTGRAAKRLTELTGKDACTIHRLLKWDLHSNTFAMNETNPLSCKVLVIDEFSMVDSLLLSKLFDASKRVKKILFVGDYHQLPSVGPGNVLRDLMETEIPICELDTIFRQGNHSGIVSIADEINHNCYDFNIFKEYNDIDFYECRNIDIVKNTIIIVKKALESGYDMNDIQVLAPMYQGVAGIDALNEALQEVFNPAKDYKMEMKVGKKLFREGDKVLQLKNRVDDNVFNGDIGTLVEICPKDNFEYLEDTFVIDFDGTMVEYGKSDFQELTHAYCMSIHKSQGSEFKIVIMSVIGDYYYMLRRNLIYTGITRAKQKLFILGENRMLELGLSKDEDEARKTTLALRFSTELNLYDFVD